jgi:subtilisin family serine protease
MIALMQQRRVLAALAVTAAIFSFGLPASASTGGSSSTAGRFIVQLRDGVDAPSTAAEYRRGGGSEIDYVYTAALDGFAGSFSHAALGELERDGRVVRIERDAAVHATAIIEQTGATWGIDRIDQTPLPLNGTYNYATTASNVTAYIIDTGIRFSHSQFAGGRAVSGYDAVDGGSADDCNGHGTHVAGTVGGSTYGVAKQVHLVAVRVLNCQGSGTWAGVAAGIDWVTNNHAGLSVANMSLGGGRGGVDAIAQLHDEATGGRGRTTGRGAGGKAEAEEGGRDGERGEDATLLHERNHERPAAAIQ